MKTINWRVRLKNKNFWITFIPAMLMLVQVVLSIFGYSFEVEKVQGKLLDLVDAVFTVLVIVGVINDPTTVGLSDSKAAMEYSQPKIIIGENRYDRK